VKQSLQYLQAIVNALQLQVSNIGTQVGVGSSQLSSTNQNSIALALQNFQTALNQQANAIVALQKELSGYSARNGRNLNGIGIFGRRACHVATVQPHRCAHRS
jgi:hypothetical protein